MTLSERERRMLQEMETHLLAEDPGLASSLGASRLRLGTRVVLAASGLVIGLLVMGVGVVQGDTVGILIALLGFLVLLAATTVGVESLRARGQRGPTSQRTGSSSPGAS
jgi:hypothetical protein